MRLLTIGTRGSALALWQAGFVRSALTEAHDGLRVELEVVRTRGDRIKDAPLNKVGGKGLFTKEIEQKLLSGEVDLAVHSLKDLPVDLPEGLALAAVTAREDPADVLVAAGGSGLEGLPEGAEVWTGSLRRRAQLLHRRPDLQVRPVRGNVETRLRKFDESGADAIVFARAGLARLGLLGRVTERLDPASFLPACGQGALAVEVRADDGRTARLCRALDDLDCRIATMAERAFLRELGGGCQVPIGAFARREASSPSFLLTGMVAGLDGARLLRGTLSIPAADA
ncbi:MAG: hydroxymethylbilane synthase, partial [Planctomycetota bacterium]